MAVVLFIASCTNEEIVYRDREPFNPPPDAQSGFLGYYTVSSKQTTCGNCHVGHQRDWRQTAHAGAWASLVASGAQQASCNECHSVTDVGNATPGPAGYSRVADSAYHDVQCESCHGPGFEHVQDPDVEANHPLASIHVDVGMVSSCSGCHTGIHTPFVEQWKLSAHGSGEGFEDATSASCLPCHEGRAAIATKFGSTANYIEKGGTTPQRIGCAVCHNPHGSPYEHQLRAPLSEPTVDQLCVKCHSRKGTPPWGTATATSPGRGAHGAQGLLVIGQNIGWIPPGFTYDTNQIVSSHGTQANPGLCATCHVVRTTVTDQATGDFVFQSVGHTFEAIPCSDAAGIPIPCSIAVPPDTVRDFRACSNGACHIGGPSVARNAYLSERGTLNNLLDQIWLDSDGNAVIDSTDGGMVPQLVARALRPGATAADTAEINFGSTTTTVAKGTLFNASLAATDTRPHFLGGTVLGRSFSAHKASGNGVHNPFLLEALLTSSIDAMRTTYGLSLRPDVDLRIRATPPPGLRMRASGR